jgi:hypothetical protein
VGSTVVALQALGTATKAPAVEQPTFAPQRHLTTAWWLLAVAVALVDGSVALVVPEVRSSRQTVLLELLHQVAVAPR